MVKYLFCFIILAPLLSFAQATGEPDTSMVELIRIYPEPFHEVLTFEFKVHDDKMHPVNILIMNTRDEMVFFESVLLYQNHEKITINTVDFFDVGLYSINVEIDKKYKTLKKFKRY